MTPATARQLREVAHQSGVKVAAIAREAVELGLPKAAQAALQDATRRGRRSVDDEARR